jgi:hypothetical protein
MSLVAVPVALAILIPTSAAAADSDQPVTATTAEGDPQEPSTEPSQPPPSDPTAPTPTEEPAPTTEPTPTEEPAPTEEPTPTEDVSEEPTEAQEPVVPVTDAEPDGVDAVQQIVADPPPRVTICHRTADRTNPYDQLSVALPQVAEGHALLHTGPVFTPDGPRPWGDIIPPNPSVPNGKNWPEGRPILDNGCEVEPDPGALPSATIGEVVCTGTVPSLDVTVSNDADATAPAFFAIVVDGDVAQTAGPIAPGESATVTLTAAGLAARENQTFTVQVRSGGQVIAAEVITVDCEPPPPAVELIAELDCVAGGAVGALEVTNNGLTAVTVTVRVNGAPFGSPLVVGPGDTETDTADFSQFEDQTITVQVHIDGQVIATYTPTPDCDQAAIPRVSVAGVECPPPSATATLSNIGDPESTVVFRILVNGRVVQQSAPLFGGDTTTIVVDLRRFEDQRITIELRANGQVLGRRTLFVDCEQPGAGDAGQGDAGPAQGGNVADDAVLPVVGAPFDLGMVALGLGLVVGGGLLVVASRRGPRPARALSEADGADL